MCSYVTGTEGTKTVRSLDYIKLLRRSVHEWKPVTFSQTDHLAEQTVDQSNDHVSNYLRCCLFS